MTSPSPAGEPERSVTCTFEAPCLRHAVDLADELRTIAGNAVRIRPGPLRPPSRRRWTVTVTTTVSGREEEMTAVARRHPGCRFVGSRLVPRH